MDNKPCVLIVEDEHNILGIMRTVLQMNGYRVLEASDATQALAMIPSHLPDMMILDLGLPDMDGMNVIKSVREWSRMPILVVSARDQ